MFDGKRIKDKYYSTLVIPNNRLVWFLVTYLEHTHLTYWHHFNISGVQKVFCKIFKKGTDLVLHIIVSYLLVYGHTVQLEAARVKLLWTVVQEILFMSPGKWMSGKQPHFIFSCWNVLSHLVTKISPIEISHIFIGISFGFILRINKPVI